MKPCNHFLNRTYLMFQPDNCNHFALVDQFIIYFHVKRDLCILDYVCMCSNPQMLSKCFDCQKNVPNFFENHLIELTLLNI